nr:cytoplasmic 60S subunit biogenesis factor REI1 homolog 1-like [Ipomoea batatas]
MPGLTCNACNKEFIDDAEQKLHYKSEWHRYNLKRKVAGVPGVTETLFLARQSVLAEENKKLTETPMLYTCGVCGKEYRSSQAYSQHLKSKSHLLKASQEPNHNGENRAIIRPLQQRPILDRSTQQVEEDVDESEESEWEEVDEEDMAEATDSLMHTSNENMQDADMDDYSEELDPSCCFMCDLKHRTIESCMVHMHKQHGFFIPDVEYLKDPKGFLTYVGLKVKRDYLCLYCNDRCHPFSSLEGVRKHMEAKSHCKVHYGDGGDDEEAELEEFYDYSSSYVDANGKELVASGDTSSGVELGSGGAELIIKKRTDDGVSTITLGSREFLRYYRQKLRPTRTNDIALSAALASRYRSMGLATVQSRENMVKMKVMKAMNRSGHEAMRTKIGIRNNVIRNLPNNVPY